MVRFKNRYFAVEVHPIDKPQNAPFYLNSYAFQGSVLKKVEQLHGDFGIAAVQAGFADNLVTLDNSDELIFHNSIIGGPILSFNACIGIPGRFDEFKNSVAKYCNKWTCIAMIRTRHGPHRLVASSLPLMNEVSGHQITVRTLYVGATLQQCYRFIRRYQRRQLIKIWCVLKTEEERRAMENAVMDLKPLESFMLPHQPGKKSS